VRSDVCTLESKVKDRRNEHHTYILSPIIKKRKKIKNMGISRHKENGKEVRTNNSLDFLLYIPDRI